MPNKPHQALVIYLLEQSFSKLLPTNSLKEVKLTTVTSNVFKLTK